MTEPIEILFSEAVILLKKLISTPSFSREEADTATIIDQFLVQKGIQTNRFLNNIWAKNKYYDENKPTILLNSHHDTVKPNKAYTLDPFNPLEENGKIFGLGSNDAGGCLVSLIATFLHFYPQEHLKYNFILATSAEEEISGSNGIEILLPLLPPIDFGIVGEPTKMNLALAEKGLMVLDCVATGIPGHAAREEGDNALYKAVKDLNWIMNYRFDKVSDLLGSMKMTATVINTENKQHNVIPPQCTYVVDVRVNELYNFEEVLDIIRANVESSVTPRSFRLRSTAISVDHPIVQSGIQLGRTYYGSPTTSDKALMDFPALKMGPGDSSRSHAADEYIFTEEIKEGIDLYIQLLNTVVK
jgi:acetylornithine deacetylase